MRPTCGPLLILSPALKHWGPPIPQGLCKGALVGHFGTSVCVCIAKPPLTLARSARRGGQPLLLPLINKTLAVATDRFLRAPPCVCIALCVDRQTTPYFSSLRSTRGLASAHLTIKHVCIIAVPNRSG